MLSNLVAVLWSVYVVRAWTRPGEVSPCLARFCKCIAGSLGLSKKTYLCSCSEPATDQTDPAPSALLQHNGDGSNGRAVYKECSTTEDDVLTLNGCGKRRVPSASGFQACDWHLVLDVLDRIILFIFCIVMLSAISILFIILPYIYGKIFT